MKLDKFKTIGEVTTGADFNESWKVTKQVNECLDAGWILIAVHQRGYSDVDTTVYIFGHTETNAVLPEFKAW